MGWVDEERLSMQARRILGHAPKVDADKAKKAFTKRLNKLFTEHKGLHAITWRQYTEFFNDGSPLDFRYPSGYDDQVFLNGQHVYGDSYSVDVDIRFENSENGKAAAVIDGLDTRKFDDLDFEVVSKAIGDINASHLVAMFGNHSQITVYRDGRIDVTEYRDHD